jgi:hypothetical protein
MSPLFGAAIATVRAWTRVYTWRLPRALRESRRAEIESDLWESGHDDQSPRSAMHIVVRLLLGIPDDVEWRIAHASTVNNAVMIIIALTTTLFFVGALWMVDLLKARRLPVPPGPALVAPAAPAAPRPAARVQTSHSPGESV